MREFAASAASTGTFGRVQAHCREHTVLLDGPVWNGCLGEEITPGEMFLAAIASCAVELIEVIARDREISIGATRASVVAKLDPADPVREDLTVFREAHVAIVVSGCDQATAESLVAGFQARCPLYGTLAAATPSVTVHVSVDR